MRNQPTPQNLGAKTLGNATWNTVAFGWALIIGLVAIQFVVNHVNVLFSVDGLSREYMWRQKTQAFG